MKRIKIFMIIFAMSIMLTTSVYGDLTPTTWDTNKMTPGGSVSGNYASLTEDQTVMSVFGASSGKWYFEMSQALGAFFGVGDSSVELTGIHADFTGMYAMFNGNMYADSIVVQGGLTVATAGVVVGIALDMDNNLMQLYINNVAQGNTVALPDGTYYAVFQPGGGTQTTTLKTDHSLLTFAPPAGFTAGFGELTGTGSASDSVVLDFDNESEWVQEDAAVGTDFDSGIVELYQTVGSESNIAPQATPTASSSYLTWGPHRLIDGQTDVSNDYRWISAWPAAPTETAYLTFSEAKTITKYHLYGYITAYGLKDYAMYYSTSSASGPWVAASSGTAAGTTDGTGEITFPSSITARWWKVDVTSNYYATYRCISEWKMFGASSISPTSQAYYVYSDDSQIDTSLWLGIESITADEVTPADTSIRYLVSFDGRSTWKYWTGAAWSSTTLSDLQTYGMSGSQLTAITESEWDTGFIAGTFDFAIDFKTTDSSQTPQLDKIDITYSVNDTPTYSEFSSDGDTTDFSAIDSSAVDNPILANSYAKIEWKTAALDLSGANLDSAIQFNSNFVSVDSAAVSALNTVANITMKNTYYTSVDTYYILKDGSQCGDCIKHSASPVKFEVSGFSNYTTEGNGSAIPEFSTMTLGIGLLTILIGLVLIRRNK